MQTMAGMLTVLGGMCLAYGIVDRCLLTIERCSRYKWLGRRNAKGGGKDADG